MSSIPRLVKNIFKVGPRSAFKQMLTIGEVKTGTLVGVDKFGNKYFENKEEVCGRDRWIEYAHYHSDSSQIPSEWHGWVHKIIDEPPTVNPPISYKYLQEHTENFTGTPKAYKTYNTTAPKITAWEPKVLPRT
ncbi:hypothetical protein Glove_508g61 [Diversispora epigaea]|uniref:NADH dehydrogenase [ubiquinone] 1 alpha subcomplex subunit n=1 Tax=Diversispora epigaea TaxID=1348612 RepID=A0A397GG25_9GLOM|nr:hypothetical protein Glove_508g61 [Diversispora epigaea]